MTNFTRDSIVMIYIDTYLNTCQSYYISISNARKTGFFSMAGVKVHERKIVENTFQLY